MTSKYSIQYIAETLKKARLGKKMSQQALGKMAHLPQSHISKIENGLVDLQASSLLELSRLLELELMFIPLPLIPTVQSLLRTTGKATKRPRPMYRLEEEDEDED